MPLKLRNRAVETLLTAWAEPWAAFAHALGLADERPALDQAWRTLLCNQAHDSICGCSIDPVHERMVARYDDAEGLGTATVQRVLERIAGQNITRDTPMAEAQTVVVFNASATPRTDVVRVPLDGFPPWWASVTRFDMHPLSMPSFRGVTVDGRPARLVAERRSRPGCVSCPGWAASTSSSSPSTSPRSAPQRYLVEPAGAALDEVDDAPGDRRGRRPCGRGRRRHALGHARRPRPIAGLFGIEDAIDRGDSYDCDPDPVRDVSVQSVTVERTAAQVGNRAAARCARARRDRHAHRRRAASRRACRSCVARCTLDNPRARPSPATALPDRCADRHVRRRDHVRHRAPFDRARRRHRLDPSRAADVPAAGLDRGQRPRRRRARAARGRGDTRRRDARHARTERRRAGPDRAALAADAGRTGDDGARRADAGSDRRDDHARPHGRRRSGGRDRHSGVCSVVDDTVAGVGHLAARPRSRHCVLSACKPARRRRPHRRARAESRPTSPTTWSCTSVSTCAAPDPSASTSTRTTSTCCTKAATSAFTFLRTRCAPSASPSAERNTSYSHRRKTRRSFSTQSVISQCSTEGARHVRAARAVSRREQAQVAHCRCRRIVAHRQRNPPRRLR